mgnify:CR=1 FL=1
MGGAHRAMSVFERLEIRGQLLLEKVRVAQVYAP